jgi:hypothetical protein
MKQTRRIEITLETSQVFEVKLRRQRALGWCPQCATTVQMLTPEAAALAFSISTRAIYRGVEEGQLHFTETTDGLLLVCSASLQAVLRGAA